MREKEWIAGKFTELSKKLGKCVYEMVGKGTCPKRNECLYPHLKDSALKRQSSKKGICFRELEGPGKCIRGPDECRYSHEITDEHRKDKEYREKVQHERQSKKSIV